MDAAWSSPWNDDDDQKDQVADVVNETSDDPVTAWGEPATVGNRPQWEHQSPKALPAEEATDDPPELLPTVQESGGGASWPTSPKAASNAGVPEDDFGEFAEEQEEEDEDELDAELHRILSRLLPAPPVSQELPSPREILPTQQSRDIWDRLHRVHSRKADWAGTQSDVVKFHGSYIEAEVKRIMQTWRRYQAPLATGGDLTAAGPSMFGWNEREEPTVSLADIYKKKSRRASDSPASKHKNLLPPRQTPNTLQKEESVNVPLSNTDATAGSTKPQPSEQRNATEQLDLMNIDMDPNLTPTANIPAAVEEGSEEDWTAFASVPNSPMDITGVENPLPDRKSEIAIHTPIERQLQSPIDLSPAKPQAAHTVIADVLETDKAPTKDLVSAKSPLSASAVEAEGEGEDDDTFGEFISSPAIQSPQRNLAIDRVLAPLRSPAGLTPSREVQEVSLSSNHKFPENQPRWGNAHVLLNAFSGESSSKQTSHVSRTPQPNTDLWDFSALDDSVSAQCPDLDLLKTASSPQSSTLPDFSPELHIQAQTQAPSNNHDRENAAWDFSIFETPPSAKPASEKPAKTKDDLLVEPIVDSRPDLSYLL